MKLTFPDGAAQVGLSGLDSTCQAIQKPGYHKKGSPVRIAFENNTNVKRIMPSDESVLPTFRHLRL